jgi:hypothetical protein
LTTAFLIIVSEMARVSRRTYRLAAYFLDRRRKTANELPYPLILFFNRIKQAPLARFVVEYLEAASRQKLVRADFAQFFVHYGPPLGRES